jgi:hypothetical protein
MLVLDPPPEDTDSGAEAHRLLGEFMVKLDAAAEAGQPPGLRAVQ